MCWGINFYFLFLELGKIIIQVFFKEKENVSFNSIFFCGSFYMSHYVTVSRKYTMVRLGIFLVFRFKTHWSEDLPIFQSLTDGTAECHFRDFSAIMIKSLIMCIVNYVHLKPSFLFFNLYC